MGILLVEPAVVPDEPVVIAPIYCSGLAAVQHIDGALHFVLYIDQPSTVSPGQIDRIINCRFVMPLEGVATGLPPVIATLTAAMTGKIFSSGWLGHG